MAQNLVYFPGFELINMDPDPGLQYSTTKLIKSYIEDDHDFTILLDEQVGMDGYEIRQSLSQSAAKATK